MAPRATVATRQALTLDGHALPARLTLAPGARRGEARPVVIVRRGAPIWHRSAVHHFRAARRPDWHRVVVDRPLRPDWEAVLTPIVDALVAHPDVDARRLAIVGYGQGSYDVARGLAFERRIAAAVVEPGVTDASSPWLRTVPDAMRAQLERGDRDAFDRQLRVAELFDPALTETIDTAAAPYELDTDSRFDLFRRVGEFRLADETARRITTPLLIATHADADLRWPGQSEHLHRLVRSAQLLTDAGPSRDDRVVEWLAARLGG